MLLGVSLERTDCWLERETNRKNLIGSVCVTIRRLQEGLLLLPSGQKDHKSRQAVTLTGKNLLGLFPSPISFEASTFNLETNDGWLLVR